MRFAFVLAEKLGIDDPIAWFDAAPPSVVDGWLAFYAIKNDEQDGKQEMVDPTTAFQRLSKNRG